MSVADYGQYEACRLSKIRGPLHCIPTAKDSVKFRAMNKKKHKNCVWRL